jgi:hypothetical protein
MWRMEDGKGVQYIHVGQSLELFELNEQIKTGVSEWPEDGTVLFWCKAPPLKKPYIDQSHRAEKLTHPRSGGHYIRGEAFVDPEKYYTVDTPIPLPDGDVGLVQQLSTDSRYPNRYYAIATNTQRRTVSVKCRVGLVSLQLIPYVIR